MKEKLSRFFNTRHFSVLATYHSAHQLRGDIEHEGTNDIGVESTRPRFVCLEADLVLDTDTDWRASKGRVLTMPPASLLPSGSEYMGDKSYTIVNPMVSGDGFAELWLSEVG